MGAMYGLCTHTRVDGITVPHGGTLVIGASVNLTCLKDSQHLDAVIHSILALRTYRRQFGVSMSHLFHPYPNLMMMGRDALYHLCQNTFSKVDVFRGPMGIDYLVFYWGKV